MASLIPLSIAAPVLAAAILMLIHSVIPRWIADLSAIVAAAGGAVMTGLIFMATLNANLVYWIGGWSPVNGAAVGIGLVADPIAAACAVLVSLLGTLSLLFSWHYFDSVGTLFHALMLVFIGAMVGFCFSGDIFTMFVFFELMSVAAYVLTGYKTEEPSLEGCLNFAVTNSVGGFLILYGIAFLYGRTGALNMAQISHALSQPADGLIVAAFILITSGLLVKAAVIPFHFWLADAHAVAPAPVCALFSGIMVELGLYATARLYWVVFHGALADEEVIQRLLLGLGALTAIIGGLTCLLQRHLKRMLAFSTISHAGLLLVGIGLLSPVASAGVFIYLVAHGMVKAALFLATGLLLHRYDDVDELRLRGQGRQTPIVGLLLGIGACGLAGLPIFGTAVGKSMIEGATSHRLWISVVFFVASMLTAAAVFRATGRIFFGWGPTEEEAGSSTVKERAVTKGERQRVPRMMLLSPCLLLGLALGLRVIPDVAGTFLRAAERFHNSAEYVRSVLEGQTSLPGPIPVGQHSDLVTGVMCTAAALAIAAFQLFRNRLLSKRVDATVRSFIAPLVFVLENWHNGMLADYLVWLMVGVALFGLPLMMTVM